MSASLGLLKHIACPKGDDCTAYRCLFRHKGDEEAWPLPSDGQPPRPSPSAAPQAAQEEQPRKRQKMTTEEYDPTSPVFPGLRNDAVPEAPAPRLQDQENAASPVTARKPVSPPPLKRKATSAPSSKGQGKTTPSKTDNGAPGFAVVLPATKLPAAAAAVRKAESLNPRMLNNPPASHEIRHKILKTLHAEYVRLNKELEKAAKDDDRKLLLSPQELIWLALDEEEKHALDKPKIYSNVIKNRIMVYRKLSADKWREERLAAYTEQNPTNPTANTAGLNINNTSEPPKEIITGLTAAQEVSLLKSRLQTPIRNLAQYGYVPTPPSEKDIQDARDGDEMSQGWEVCDRCKTRFQVFPGRREEDGALASGGPCVHHPGRTYYPQRQAGDRTTQERRYKCCGQEIGDSVGCATAETHVWKAASAKRMALLWNFVETPPNPTAPEDRAVCFDCEMGYTVKGFELIRLTATSWPDGAELLDILVQPMGEIMDLNSRYSGVWPEDIVNALPFSATEKPPPAKEGERKRLPMVSSPVVARDLLFSLISPETPLIGHGLENDLNCLRVIHPTLADSILLYPHSKGLPLRKGLKVLMEQELGRLIQVEEVNGKVQGHDSAEDARAAGELVRLKVKKTWDQMRKDGWTLAGGDFVPPGAKKQAK